MPSETPSPAVAEDVVVVGAAFPDEAGTAAAAAAAAGVVSPVEHCRSRLELARLHCVELASWGARLEPCLDPAQGLAALLVRERVGVHQVGNPAEAGRASRLVGLGALAADEL